MKSSILFIFLFIYTGLIGQSVILLEQDSVSQINQGVDISNNFKDFAIDLFFKNNTDEPISVHWKREFGDNCPLEWDILVADQFFSYTPDIDESQSPLLLNPTDSNFIVRQLYFPRMVPGCCDISISFSLEGAPDTPIDTAYYHIEINANGCVTTSILNEPTSTIEIFPNPTTDFVFIKSDEDIESIEFSDVGGSILHYLVYSKTYQLDLSDFASGIYYCTIKNTSGALQTKKIIKL